MVMQYYTIRALKVGTKIRVIKRLKSPKLRDAFEGIVQSFRYGKRRSFPTAVYVFVNTFYHESKPGHFTPSRKWKPKLIGFKNCSIYSYCTVTGPAVSTYSRVAEQRKAFANTHVFDIRRSLQESPHSILGLSITATAEEIKRRYRKLVFTCHPDKVKGKEALFIKYTNAYDTLLQEVSVK